MIITLKKAMRNIYSILPPLPPVLSFLFKEPQSALYSVGFVFVTSLSENLLKCCESLSLFFSFESNLCSSDLQIFCSYKSSKTLIGYLPT